ncbi:Hsp70 family protein [Pseudonocardia benzenivorans]
MSHVNFSSGGALAELDMGDPQTAIALARLRQDCVLAKEALSIDSETTIPVFLPGRHFDVRITRGEFEDMIRAPIESTIGTLSRTLRSAQVEPANLSAVLLVGGSSRIPLVSRMISEELGRPTVVDAHPKYAVALGAATLAAASASGRAGARAARSRGRASASRRRRSRVAHSPRRARQAWVRRRAPRSAPVARRQARRRVPRRCRRPCSSPARGSSRLRHRSPFPRAAGGARLPVRRSTPHRPVPAGAEHGAPELGAAEPGPAEPVPAGCRARHAVLAPAVGPGTGNGSGGGGGNRKVLAIVAAVVVLLGLVGGGVWLGVSKLGGSSGGGTSPTATAAADATDAATATQAPRASRPPCRCPRSPGRSRGASPQASRSPRPAAARSTSRTARRRR